MYVRTRCAQFAQLGRIRNANQWDVINCLNYEDADLKARGAKHIHAPPPHLNNGTYRIVEIERRLKPIGNDQNVYTCWSLRQPLKQFVTGPV